ncbi:MAG: hypothetical protein LBU39_00390, partial [Desulfobulbaceae bacterium]|jgi:hypothetical protein|nr:hypothetical protein [Desulfobulbaceae bacterium]
MNGSGTRDTGRVLNVSKDTVTSVLKKQKNSQSKLMKNTFNSGVEILPDLKKKYPSYLKPDFHSIKITHNDGIVYLESVRYRRSDFKDEIIERIDLGFIINGTSEMLFLASRNPEDNARLFVHQLDEYSMINCTYLFTHEACVEIAQRHERG